MKYRLQTWKLTVEGEYLTEIEAILDLSDKYLRCSKCDLPGESLSELLSKDFNVVHGNSPTMVKLVNDIENVNFEVSTNKKTRTITDISKTVWLYTEEIIYNRPQWIEKQQIRIYPFKTEHWWDTPSDFTYNVDAKYEILN